MLGSILRTLCGLFLLILAVTTATAVHAATSRIPPALANLLPKTATLKNGDWAVFGSEFGKTLSGGMFAQFPNQPNTCDNTVGPELRVTIKGDTAWESPPMLDMAIEIFESDIQNAKKSLHKSVTTMLKTNSGVRSIGTLQDEQLSTGHILYVEFKEDCARHPGGSFTVLRGFSRKGATMLTIELVLTKSAGEARMMATEMFSRFQQLDVAALVK